MLTLPGWFDAEKMAMEWCKQVDGVNHVFPDVARIGKHGERNRWVQDAAKSMTSRIQMLDEINKKEAPAADKVVRNPTMPPTMLGKNGTRGCQFFFPESGGCKTAPWRDRDQV
jgi:hypothetical protein